MNLKKFPKVVIIVTFLILGVSIFLVIKNSSAAASVSDNVSGWAWSETIGWISFNCSNSGSCGSSNYGVNVKNNGDLEGYAWAENIGWVSFNETGGCPSSPCKPKLNEDNGQISGWAKALAGRDGWDGWIHLRGSNYGVSVGNCEWSGYAWGSDVVGWIHFKGSNYGVLGAGDSCVSIPALSILSFNATPSSIYVGDSSTLGWSTSGATSCNINQGIGSVAVNGTQSVSPATTTAYTLSCSNAGSSSSATTTVTVSEPLTPKFKEITPE